MQKLLDVKNDDFHKHDIVFNIYVTFAYEVDTYKTSAYAIFITSNIQKANNSWIPPWPDY